MRRCHLLYMLRRMSWFGLLLYQLSFRGQTDTPRPMYLRRHAHAANVPLSLRSPVSVATNRSAGRLLLKIVWGNHTFPDLFSLLLADTYANGRGPSTLPPLLYPRLFLSRYAFREETVRMHHPLLGSVRIVIKQLFQYKSLTVAGSISSCFLSYAVVFTLVVCHW